MKKLKYKEGAVPKLRSKFSQEEKLKQPGTMESLRRYGNSSVMKHRHRRG